MKGYGVSAGFQADTSEPGDIGNEVYMSLKTYAHYTYEDKGTNHMICIVGWDDEYPASSFLDGHQPPADGAWLVKNSWVLKLIILSLRMAEQSDTTHLVLKKTGNTAAISGFPTMTSPWASLKA